MKDDYNNEVYVSRRREVSQRVGFVNFPKDGDETYRHTGEGGMFVQLVVVDNPGDKEYYNRWNPCCGGSNAHFSYDECFISDDQNPIEKSLRGEATSYTMVDIERDERNHNDRDERHFPFINTKNNDIYQHRSRDYLCVMMLGGTGWSNGSWHCTYDDLSEEGQTLYASLERLYPNCQIHLLTWLDT